MNTQPAQPIPSNGRQPDPDQTAIPINTAQLAHIAELFDILDGFLRRTHGIADHLGAYLPTRHRRRPAPTPHWAGYTADLLIDQVSFTAHNLRADRRKLLP